MSIEWSPPRALVEAARLHASVRLWPPGPAQGAARAAGPGADVPWRALGAALTGALDLPYVGDTATLLGEMVNPPAVSNLAASGLLDGVETLRVIGRLGAPASLWSLLDACPHLAHLDLRAVGDAPTGGLRDTPRLRSVRLVGQAPGWLGSLGRLGALDTVEHIDASMLRGASLADWRAAPVGRLTRLDAGVSAAPYIPELLDRLPARARAVGLNKIIVNRGVAERLVALTGIERLSLRSCQIAPTAEKHLEAVAPRLSALDVAHARASRDAISALVTCAARCRSLDLSGTVADVEMIRQALRSARSLEQLAARGVRASAARWARLADPLAHCGLRSIDLSGCAVDDRLGVALSGAQWRSICLRDTHIGSPTATALLGRGVMDHLACVDLDNCPIGRLGERWAPRPALRVMRLSGTALTVDDPPGFFAASRLPRLLDLDLAHNELEGHAAEALATALAELSVRRLRLTGSRRWSPGQWAAVYRAVAPTVATLTVGRDWSTHPDALSGLLEQSCPALTHLDASEGEVAAASVAALRHAERFPSLAELRVSGDAPMHAALAEVPLIADLAHLQAIGDADDARSSPQLGPYVIVEA